MGSEMCIRDRVLVASTLKAGPFEKIKLKGLVQKDDCGESALVNREMN